LWTGDIFSGQVTSGLVFAQEAKKAGIDIAVKKLPSDQFFSKIYGIKPLANDYWYLFPILTLMSSAFIPKAPYAYVASWITPRATRLYRAAAAEINPQKRNELTRELMTFFRDNGPYIVWAHEASPDLYSARIGGQETSAVRNLNGFRFEKYFTRS
jgi:peptide/nickel transport system substrate-binding protein